MLDCCFPRPAGPGHHSWTSVAIGAAVAAMYARAVVLGTLSRRWPVAAGRIVSAEVTTWNSYRYKHRPEVLYAYSVGDRDFTGRRIWYGATGVSYTFEAPAAIVARYAPETPVQVRYRPGHPDDCVLEPGATSRALTIFLLGVTFAVTSALV